MVCHLLSLLPLVSWPLPAESPDPIPPSAGPSVGIRVVAGLPLRRTGPQQQCLAAGPWLDVRVLLANPQANGPVDGVLRISGRHGETSLAIVEQNVHLDAGVDRVVHAMLHCPILRTVAGLAASRPTVSGARPAVSPALPLEEAVVSAAFVASTPPIEATADARISFESDPEFLPIFQVARSGFDLIHTLTADAEMTVRKTNRTLYVSLHPLISRPADLLLMPDSPSGYAGASFLLIHDLSVLDDITGAQQLAIAAWVRSGGRLFLCPTSAQQVKLPFVRQLVQFEAAAEPVIIKKDSGDALLPFVGCPLFGIRPENLQQAKAYPSGTAGRPGARPLFWSVPVDRGQVDVLCLDPAGDWFTGRLSQEQRRDFWTRIITQFHDETRGERTTAEPLLRTPDADLAAALASGLTALPSVRTIALVLTAYLLLLGPINYGLLRRYARPAWAVLTIPLTAVVFTGVVLWVGFAQRGSATTLHRLCLAEIRPGGRFVAIENAAMLFAAGNLNYSIEIPGRSGLRFLSLGRQSGQEDLRLKGDGDRLRVMDRRLSRWKVDCFATRGERLLAGPVTASRKDSAEGEILTVQNDADMTVVRAWVCTGVRFRPVPLTAPLIKGKGLTLSIDRASPPAEPAFDDDRSAGAFLQAAGTLAAGAAAEASTQASRPVLLMELAQGFDSLSVSAAETILTRTFAWFVIP